MHQGTQSIQQHLHLNVSKQRPLPQSLAQHLSKQIERSKSHWTQLVDPDSKTIEEEVAAKIANQEMFKTLQMHPTLGHFFLSFGEEFGRLLAVGDKFAEGGQAELYYAQVTCWDPKNKQTKEEAEGVLKVFKKDALLRDLQLQRPHGLFYDYVERVVRTQLGKPPRLRWYSLVYCATLLEDGRFAFLMQREHEGLIDRKVLENAHGCEPYSDEVAEAIMYQVALGMVWPHSCNTVHRDLKASNVLVHPFPEDEHL